MTCQCWDLGCIGACEVGLGGEGGLELLGKRQMINDGGVDLRGTCDVPERRCGLLAFLGNSGVISTASVGGSLRMFFARLGTSPMHLEVRVQGSQDDAPGLRDRDALIRSFDWILNFPSQGSGAGSGLGSLRAVGCSRRAHYPAYRREM